MYAGHFAAGLVLKAKEPHAPMWGILIGVGLLDLLFGPFVLVGLERASVTPGASPGFSLDHIDWSHSLVMSVVWSLLYAGLFIRWGARVAGIMGLAAFSHFLLDLPMHPPDMALWPGSDIHLGLGLWRTLPQGWWFVELAVIVPACVYYLRKARTSTEFGGRAVAVAVVVLLLHVTNSPWLSAL
jgi:hypothetical protein